MKLPDNDSNLIMEQVLRESSELQAVESNMCPLLALWDFAAAFSSVAHGWLFVVLEEGHFPSGFRNIVKAMYTLVRMYTKCDSDVVFLCWIL